MKTHWRFRLRAVQRCENVLLFAKIIRVNPFWITEWEKKLLRRSQPGRRRWKAGQRSEVRIQRPKTEFWVKSLHSSESSSCCWEHRETSGWSTKRDAWWRQCHDGGRWTRWLAVRPEYKTSVESYQKLLMDLPSVYKLSLKSTLVLDEKENVEKLKSV